MTIRSHERRSQPDTQRYRNPDADSRGPWLASDLTFPVERPHLRFELLGSFPPSGRSWRYTQQRSEALVHDGLIKAKPNGRPFLKRYLADIPQERPEVTDFPAVIREFSAKLARRLALQPGDLPHFEWRDLERALAAACEGIGFRTCLTRGAKDGGFDIAVSSGDDDYVIEVKHWSAPSLVGDAVVAQFAEIVVSRQAVRGLLLSSSGFRPAVLAQRLEVTPKRVAIGDGRKIVGLCQRYLETEQGLWSPSTDLAEILFLDTL